MGDQDDPPNDPDDTVEGDERSLSKRIADKITPAEWERWYLYYLRQENAREGKPWMLSAAPVPNPEKHAPSRVKKCHRKGYYNAANAPEEDDEPRGIFFMGRRVENDLVIEFLSDVTERDLIVGNDLDIYYTVEHNGVELYISGDTDPVVLDSSGTPILPSEIKTAENLPDAPRPWHKAQIHAYIYGVRERYDADVDHGLLLYFSRESLDMTVFDVSFDPEFWEEVLDWTVQQTEYREQGVLPPAEPEYGWECEYCAYRHRCGQSDQPFEDHEPEGFLPGIEYPVQKVREYLSAHPEAELTPTIAAQYPELVEEHAVQDWTCSRCKSRYAWGSLDWDGNLDSMPNCGSCAEDGYPVELRGPRPD